MGETARSWDSGPHDSESCGFGERRGAIVIHADLTPEHLRPDCDGLLGEPVELFLGAEINHVDQIDFEGPIDLPALVVFSWR